MANLGKKKKKSLELVFTYQSKNKIKPSHFPTYSIPEV